MATLAETCQAYETSLAAFIQAANALRVAIGENGRIEYGSGVYSMGGHVRVAMQVDAKGTDTTEYKVREVRKQLVVEAD